MVDFLENILATRKAELENTKQRIKIKDLEYYISKVSLRDSFLEGINKPGQITLIAEMKRRSPSAGVIRDPFDAGQIARDYQKGGAHAISVLTENARFGGSLEDMLLVKTASELPILRKDFIFDVYQVIEAKVHGASAVLLIADALEPVLLKELVDCCRLYNIYPLVEIFTEAALKSAVDSGAQIIGINTRNLRTLAMLPENVEKLAPLIPKDRLIVAESGIKTAEDVAKMKGLNVAAMLVGESILRQENLALAVSTLVQAGA
ncbi:MAG: indole-3-glycerol phosphate synthase TrpC [Elusimicrobiota bacterium]